VKFPVIEFHENEISGSRVVTFRQIGETNRCTSQILVAPKNLRNLGAVENVTSISDRVSDTQSLSKKKKKKKRMVTVKKQLHSIIDFIRVSKKTYLYIYLFLYSH
jgi:ppGpp synthetase/RelA/SpoT-type nucleotidyltranferase